MSVVLNPAGLSAFFHGPQMEKILIPRAEAVEQQARENASGPILGIQTGDLLRDLSSHVESHPESLVGIVGTSAAHGVPSFGYPGYWDENGRPWLFSALQRFFPDATRV